MHGQPAFTSRGPSIWAALLLGAGMALCTGSAAAVELARVEGFGPVSRGFAGSGVAFPTGAAAMMLNPAELLSLDREQELLFQLTEIQADIIVRDSASGERFDTQNLGNNRGPYDLPEIAYARRFGDWAFGAGVFAAGGFGIEYGNDSFLSRTSTYGVYTGLPVSTRLGHLRIPFALAWRPHARWRVGASIDVVNASLNLASLLDVQQVGMLIADGRTGGTLVPVLAGIPNLAGAHFDFVRDHPLSSELSGWGVGARLGVSFQLTPSTTLGAAYEFESRLDDLKGEGTLTAIDSNNQQIAIRGSARLPAFQFPQAFVLGVAHRVSPTLAVVADLRRTFWSQTLADTQIRFRAEDGSTLDVNLPTGFNNMTTASLGVEWQFIPQWTLRVGGAHAFQPTVPDQRVSGTFPTLTRNHLATMLAWLSPAGAHEFNLGLTYGFTPTQRSPGNNVSSIPEIEAKNRLINPVLAYRYRF